MNKVLVGKEEERGVETAKIIRFPKQEIKSMETKTLLLRVADAKARGDKWLRLHAFQYIYQIAPPLSPYSPVFAIDEDTCFVL